MNVLYEKIVLCVYVENEKIMNLLSRWFIILMNLVYLFKKMDEELFYPCSIIKR
jgi:hypothetical protein